MSETVHGLAKSSDKIATDPRPHRKLVRHFDEPGHAHELTFSCYQRLPLLTGDPHRCELLSLAIDRATERHGFDLVAFVYMPEHVHLIVFPTRPDALIANLLFAIKRPFSTRAKALLHRTDPPLLGRLTIRERPGKTSFRFWQEGGGYDRNIQNLETLRLAIEYVHNNPVRRELCATPEAWRWSRWRFYFTPEEYFQPGVPNVHGIPA
jgi:putative transposase